MTNVIPFAKIKSFKEGQTTMRAMLDYLHEYRGAVVINLKIIDSVGIMIMSNTITFAHVKQDEFRPQLYVIESGGKIEAFLEDKSLDKYILTKIENNGVYLSYTYNL
ncbi:hypothetical protein COA01_34985 [Bacillus cereus]|uniref:hypothetical protein n=1 Tax=Bacillus cereus TaxID=1396 RepID=UPI000BFB8E00|nr:hypothetical protein [Bacillus cereus]PGP12028.1 hypothetical protein COA01_34985 [Bacillus cereus]